VQGTNQVSESDQSQKIDNAKGTHLSPYESTALVDAVQTWSYTVDHRQRGFFLARKVRKSPGIRPPIEFETRRAQTEADASKSDWEVASLSEYENGFFRNVAAENRFVCFADPSNYEQAPGWMLRNLLVLVKQRWGLERVQILRYRDVHSKRDQGRSLVLQLESRSQSQTPKSTSSQGPLPKVTGWERNPAGKLSGRIVNLTEYMDPKRYAILTLKILCILNLLADWRTNQLI